MQEEEGDDDEEEDDEDNIYSKYNKDIKAEWNGKPASEYPEHRWVISEKGFEDFCKLEIQADYRNPDNFAMYIYNDFWGYGIQEVIENWLLDFDKAFKSKADDGLLRLWHQMQPMFLWLANYDMGAWVHMDDADKWHDTFEIINLSLLTAMHRLDTAGELTTSSKFKDVSIVGALAICFYDRFGELGDCEDFARSLVGYFKKMNISAEESSALGIDKFIERIEEEEGETIPALSAWTKRTNDRFSWSGKFKKLCNQHGTGSRKPGIGGKQYSIIHFTRAERVESSFDGKDSGPLAKMSAKDLKDLQAGKIEIRFN
jgi:hypothetical protein